MTEVGLCSMYPSLEIRYGLVSLLTVVGEAQNVCLQRNL